MKTSVLIIAYNEENNIAQCIESLLAQTKKADEIVLIAHNCIDVTVAIAQAYKEIRIVEYRGPDGVPYARIKGFEEVSGDIVACIDGDSIAKPRWFEEITKPLIRTKKISIVAGYVILTNSFFARLTSFWQFVLFKKLFRVRINCFAWGSNFACRKSDYERVGGFAPILSLREKIGLHFWAEDFYISLALMQIGKIHFSLRAKTYTTIPEWKINLKTAPIREWREDNQALLSYFKNK